MASGGRRAADGDQPRPRGRALPQPAGDARSRSPPSTRCCVDHWRRHGFGPFALESREADDAGRFLGFAGVAYPAYLPALAERPEIGWRLARGAWGRGLATEAALAARDHAFETLGLPELIAIVHPENERSQAVARKLGMEVERQVENPVLRRPVEVWALAAPAAV